MSKLESTFNRLCSAQHGYLMIPLIGISYVGLIILIVETIKYLSR